MHPTLLLVVYCSVCVVGSLFGGWVPLVVRLTHRRMQIAISFVSGMMLGIGLLHMLPHSFLSLGSIDRTVAWVMAGFLFMFFLERFFHFHHHDVGEETGVPDSPRAAAHAHDHDHDHGRGHADNHGHATGGSVFSWGAAVIGLTLHSLVDGVALAASVAAESGEGLAVAGVGTALAIALHKPFDSLTIGTLMAADHRTPAARHLLNALYALVTPLGALLFYLFASGTGQGQHGLGQALGFAAGAFVCIATSDLLPELQFHRHDRAALSAALLAGIALAWSTVFLEAGQHDHAAPEATSHGGNHEHDAHHDDARH